MQTISYDGYRFSTEIIQQTIWLYLRFALSYRDVEDLLAERGIRSHTSIDERLEALDRPAAGLSKFHSCVQSGHAIEQRRATELVINSVRIIVTVGNVFAFQIFVRRRPDIGRWPILRRIP